MWHRLQGDAVILAYHRVTTLPPGSDPYRLAVTPATFDAQMEILRRKFRPVSLYQIADSLLGGAPLPRRAVAVTFDDGYADNALEAAPILIRHGVPAAFFVTSGMIENRDEFWWDDLERLVLAPVRLPDRFAPAWAEPFVWEANDAGREDLPAEGAVFPRGISKGRRELFLRLSRMLKQLPREEQIARLDAVAEWSDFGLVREVRSNRRTMTATELLNLSRNPLFTIGAHTMTHPRLAALPPAAQREEIEGSKRDLEALLGRSVGMIAYPYGDPASVGEAAPRAAREAGVTCGFTASGGYVRRGTDPFSVPRFFAYEWSQKEFLYELNRLL
ncbi:Polysaccharide deacetylase [Verrucomicrobium sp. GAS474]|nr:Polysaccharide deacetylase [Verrucomicrobium sp. GAS474]